VKPENNDHWRLLWDNREVLPPASHRRFIGPLLAGLKKFLGPLGDLFISGRLETQREFNLFLLRENQRMSGLMEEIRAAHARFQEESLPAIEADIRKIETHFQIHFSELQKEILTLRDEKIPALLRGQELGLKGADMKAEWALARIIQLRQMLEKGVDLAPAEKSAAARGLIYAQIEDEFRGTPQEIKEKQKPYLKELSDKGKVLDLGCGRGEFLELLKENGIPCLGLERDPAMAAMLKEKGLTFVQDDAFTFFEKPGEDFGAVTAFHFIEHFESGDAIFLLQKIASRLKEGGVLILETPNPSSLAAFLNFHKDPEHKTPWHPETLKFYLKQAGFKDVRIEFLHPFPPRPELKLPKDLADLILGYQDYAAIASK
jgi:SAM-dependent methyltransferase